MNNDTIKVAHQKWDNLNLSVLILKVYYISARKDT